MQIVRSGLFVMGVGVHVRSSLLPFIQLDLYLLYCLLQSLLPPPPFAFSFFCILSVYLSGADAITTIARGHLIA